MGNLKNLILYKTYKYVQISQKFRTLIFKMARYKRRRYYRKKNKYNLEQNPGKIIQSQWSSPATEEAFDHTANVTVVPSTEIEGVRKVKNLTISLSFTNPTEASANYQQTIYWALVYVPEGTQSNYLNEVGDLYQPSQWVLSTGIINTNSSKSRIYTPLSKNLNKGDKIVLCLGASPLGGWSTFPSIDYLCRYAICFN